MTEPEPTHIRDEVDWGIPRANLSMRIPRWAHKRMKAVARDEGRTVADLYSDVVQEFLDNQIDRWKNGLIAGPTSSPSTSLAVPRPLATRVRGIAEDRDVIISDIIYTAVLLHLGEAPPSAAAA
jgi:hypothetical protein